MYEFIVWILLGTLSGWIGFLATRSEQSDIRPYLVIGVVAAVVGGFATRNIGRSASSFAALNVTSMFMALLTSLMCIIFLGCIKAMLRNQ